MTQDYSKLYQHGTLATLVPGLYDGTLPVGELLKNGDSGIGTATGLGGEMVVLDGQAYLVTSDGQVNVLPAETLVPFATVHFADKDLPADVVVNEGPQELEDKILAKHAFKNIFFAVRLTGEFATIKTRAVAKQQRPYPPLSDVAAAQSVFEEGDSHGTLLGYFSPDLFQGMASAGFHLHYLNDAHSMGGHVLDFKIKNGQLTIQPFASVEQHFPLDNSEFMEHDFDLTQMDSEIRISES